MKTIISAALVAVLALSNVALASCMVNGTVDSTVMDKAACDTKSGTWTDANTAPASASDAAPAVKSN